MECRRHYVSARKRKNMGNCSGPRSRGMQHEENAVALVGERSGSPYFSPEPEITILPNVAGSKLDGGC